ncbi:MAG TPA: ATP-binding protein [Lunatimonas sp.]|nr:ATP-binding protein [Lunatimonas sp.]
MNLPYKIRLSLYLTLATSLIVLMAFIFIYMVANWTLLDSVDRDLALETKIHEDQISLVEGELRFLHKDEWEEAEHQEIQFHPIFIEIVDTAGNQLDKSPNLGILRLSFREGHSSTDVGFNQMLKDQEVRQMQIALTHDSKVEGYLLVATSFEQARKLLSNLKSILFLLYPIILVSLFLTMRYLAGKSIKPVVKTTKLTNLISQNNLDQRIPLSENNDEIKQLTVAINGLLERLEQAMKREQQFTSDASHELRTPLAVLRGSFEVLIRKPRTPEEYISKIQSGLIEIDKLNEIIDQLLDLARAELDVWDIHEIDLGNIVEEVVAATKINGERKINFSIPSSNGIYVRSNEKSLFIILTNLIQNALKYSKHSTEIKVVLFQEEARTIVEVRDQGTGIKEESLTKIFNPFFRESAGENRKIPGSGLGLSIVKRLCNQLGIAIFVDSQLGNGTTVRLIFPSHPEI